MRNIVFVVALLGLMSCQQLPPHLLVTLSAVPLNAQSLRVLATHDGVSAIKDPEPIDLPLPVKDSETVLIVLPENFAGDIGLSVGAFDRAGGQGCLVATGYGVRPMFAGPSDKLQVTLEPTHDTLCRGQQPMLFAADPTIGTTAGSEAVTLTGWGFKPDSTITMNGKSTSFSFVSAAKIMLTTPAKAGIGATTLRVTSRDGLFDSRSDLFRFFSDTLALTGLPFSSTPDYSSSGVFVVSKFSPTTQFDMAIALPTRNLVRVLFVVGSAIRSDLTREYSVDSNPGPLVVADFDKDGDNDIAVASMDQATITVLTNDGTGALLVRSPQSIGTPISTPPGSQPSALAAGDLNGDGLQDLVVALKSDGKIAVLLNQGAGTLQHTQGLNVGNEPVGLAIGDFNGDNLPDIAVANQAPVTGKPNNYTVSLLFNQGAGVYKDTGTGELQISVSKMPTSVAMTDTDGNGIPDLVVSCTGANKLTVFKNFGGLNVMPYDIATDAEPRNLVINDINGDAIPDIIVPCSGSDKVDFFLNSRGAGFENAKLISQAAGCTMPNRAVILDVDSDGRSDVGVSGPGCIAGIFNQSN